MTRSKLPPIKDDGQLRNNDDKLMLAGLAIGYPYPEILIRHGWTKPGSDRARQRLVEYLGAVSIYVVLVWALEPTDDEDTSRLDTKPYCYGYPAEYFEAWMRTVEFFDQTALSQDQVDHLISSLTVRGRTLEVRWSRPEQGSIEQELLDLTGLEPQGLPSFCHILTAAARTGQIRYSHLPVSRRIELEDGTVITMTGKPNQQFEAYWSRMMAALTPVSTMPAE